MPFDASKATLSASEQLSHTHKGNSSEVYFSSNLHLVFLLLFCKLCFESTFPCQQQSRAGRREGSLPPLQGFLAGCPRVSHCWADPAHGWAGGAPSQRSPTTHLWGLWRGLHSLCCATTLGDKLCFIRRTKIEMLAVDWHTPHRCGCVLLCFPQPGFQQCGWPRANSAGWDCYSELNCLTMTEHYTLGPQSLHLTGKK